MSDGAAAPEIGPVLRRAFTEEWAHLVAGLIRLTDDWALAEDCAQEAFAKASVRWVSDGVPERPGAWLTTVARNEARDRLRRLGVERRRLHDLAAEELRAGEVEESPADDEHLPDDRLRLVFTCAHPALPLEARVALTLRTVGGLTVAEIARAFSVTEAAMAKRLVRARQKIAHARIPYRVPPADQLPARRDAVLAVVYLVFTEGYSASAGEVPVRTDLCAEALRLGRLLTGLLPEDPEVHALLALMLLHDARRPARVGDDGELVPLDEQDRERWDRASVSDGITSLERAQALATADTPYLLQAEIAACHSTAPVAASTPWTTVAHLYDRLLTVHPTPHAALARAVAVGMVSGPDAGLVALRALVDQPSGDLLGLEGALAAAEADLLRRAGRPGEAAAAYRRAVLGASTEAERRHLRRRLDDMVAAAGPRPRGGNLRRSR